MTFPAIHFQKGTSKVRQIIEVLSASIESGVLPAGSKLPSVRELTLLLGVGKFTVIDALDRLRARNLLISRQGKGYFVVAQSPQAIYPPQADLLPQDLISVLRRSLLVDNGELRPGCGHLPESWLDTNAFRQAMRATVRSPLLRVSAYGSPAGYSPLRKALQKKLSEQGMPVHLEQIVTTSNTVQGIDMLLRLLLRQGDTVLLDDPCYFNFHANLALHGAQVVTVERGAEGPDFERFQAVLAKHRPSVYLSCGLLHNPTGHSFTPAQAFRLLQLCKEYGCHIIEDDLYGDLHSNPPPRLAALAGAEHVSYLSGFSKILSANTRVSYVIAAPQLAAKLSHLKLMSGGGTSELLEQLLCRMLNEGSYGKHRKRIADRLLESGGRVSAWLKRAGCTLPFPFTGGMFIWAKLPAGVNSEMLAREGMKQGLLLAPGGLFSRQPQTEQYMRFNVAFSDDEFVEHAFSALLKPCLLSV